jgi:hypothetical protein
MGSTVGKTQKQIKISKNTIQVKPAPRSQSKKMRMPIVPLEGDRDQFMKSQIRPTGMNIMPHMSKNISEPISDNNRISAADLVLRKSGGSSTSSKSSNSTKSSSSGSVKQVIGSAFIESRGNANSGINRD